MESFDDLLDKAKEKGLVTSKEGENTPEQLLEQQAEAKRLADEKAQNTELDENDNPTQEGEEPKSFIEILKGKTANETKSVEIPDEVKAEIESYKKKLELYESDPLVKAVTAEATKEQLIAIAAELNGKDYSKSSYKDLMEVEIRNEGFEGEELEEQLNAIMSEFEDLLPFQKKKAEKQIQERFQSQAKKGESPTLQALEAAYKDRISTLETPEQFKQRIDTIAQNEKKAIESVGKQLLGSQLYGVEFTADTLKEIIEKDYDVNKVSDYANEKGELDVAGFIQSKFISKNFATMIEKAKEEGRKEALKGTANTQGRGRTTTTTSNTVSKSKANKEGLLPDYILRQMPD
jgi:hypothetical protein